MGFFVTILNSQEHPTDSNKHKTKSLQILYIFVG